MPFQTVSEVARQHFPGLPPKIISDMLYRREIPGCEEACPVIGGRRLIPPDFIETMRMALRRAGKLPLTREAARV